MNAVADHLCWIHVADVGAGIGPQWDAVKVAEELHAAIATLVASEQLRPNFLFVTGSLSHNGASQEGADVVADLCARLGIGTDDTFIVPDHDNLGVLKRSDFRHLSAGKGKFEYAVVRKPLGFPVGIVGIGSMPPESRAGKPNGKNADTKFSSRSGINLDFDPVIILARTPPCTTGGELAGHFWRENIPLSQGFVLQRRQQGFWYKAEHGFHRIEAGVGYNPSIQGLIGTPEVACFNVAKVDLFKGELAVWFMEHHGGRWGPLQRSITGFDGRPTIPPVKIPWLAKHSLSSRLEAKLADSLERGVGAATQTVTRLENAFDRERITERLRGLLVCHQFHRLPTGERTLVDLAREFEFEVLEQIGQLSASAANGASRPVADNAMDGLVERALVAALAKTRAPSGQGHRSVKGDDLTEL